MYEPETSLRPSKQAVIVSYSSAVKSFAFPLFDPLLEVMRNSRPSTVSSTLLAQCHCQEHDVSAQMDAAAVHRSIARWPSLPRELRAGEQRTLVLQLPASVPSIMWRLFSVLLVIAAIVASINAQFCRPCSMQQIEECRPNEPSEQECGMRGRHRVRGPSCNCCMSCKHGLNEPCGGAHPFRGGCAPGFHCSANPDNFLPGKCTSYLPRAVLVQMGLSPP